MSPEVAATVRNQSPCLACGVLAGELCRNDRRQAVAWIHQARVIDNLFRPTTLKG